jgi:hypothetical protein
VALLYVIITHVASACVTSCSLSVVESTTSMQSSVFAAESAEIPLIPCWTTAGFRDFDNILYAWLTLFQYMTNTDWTLNMYDLWDGANWWTWPFCIMMVRQEQGCVPNDTHARAAWVMSFQHVHRVRSQPSELL